MWDNGVTRELIEETLALNNKLWDWIDGQEDEDAQRISELKRKEKKNKLTAEEIDELNFLEFRLDWLDEEKLDVEDKQAELECSLEEYGKDEEDDEKEDLQ